MGKRFAGVVVLSLLLVGLLPLRALADIGPKPFVQVDFGGGRQEFYATLLVDEKRYGPYCAWEGGEKETHGPGGEEVWQKFVEYEDPDGFCFLQYWERCTAEGGFAWTYYPPETFKLLLYFPETDTFRSSRVMHTYAFESYFYCDLSGSGEGELSTRYFYDYPRSLGRAALRAALTVVLEVGLALLFGYGEKGQLALFTVTNLVTQAGLYGALYVITYYKGPWAFWFWFAVLEAVVLLVEMGVYTGMITRCSKGHLPGRPLRRVRVYALLANGLSCGVGLALARVAPEIF